MPRATAVLGHGSVSLRVGVAANWPAPLADLLTSIRTAVADDTARLTGLAVTDVDVQSLRMTDPADGATALTTAPPAAPTTVSIPTTTTAPPAAPPAVATTVPGASPMPAARPRAGVATVVVVGVLTAVALGGL